MANQTANRNYPLELATQLFSAATADASAAMCRWTNGLITLSLDQVQEIQIEDISEEFDFGTDLLTMIVLPLAGNEGGEMILVFDELNGRKMAASLLSRDLCEEGDWSALEKSALCETGNILACAYLNAITRLIDQPLVPEPPQFIQDYGASVLQQALLTQAMISDTILVCKTGFHREGEELNWNVFFVPTPGVRDAIEGKTPA